MMAVILFYFHMFERGSAISQSLGFMTQALTMVGYIYFSRLYRETWDGESCSNAAFRMKKNDVPETFNADGILILPNVYH